MAKQTINVGTLPNDKTGDPLRTAFQKCNDNFGELYPSVTALTYSPTLTPNPASGNIQTITLTGNLTLNGFSSPYNGQQLLLIITQDAVGSRILTTGTGTWKWSGGISSLSTAANSVDFLHIRYIGTTYYATLTKGYV